MSFVREWLNIIHIAPLIVDWQYIDIMDWTRLMHLTLCTIDIGNIGNIGDGLNRVKLCIFINTEKSLDIY